MALATERIKFIVDVDTSDFVQGVRGMAQTLEDLKDANGNIDRMSMVDAIGDVALAKAHQYYDALVSITKATSDLNEAANFSLKVFGDAAPEIEKFAESAASIGFSKTSALNAAAALGVFGQTAGKTGEELVTFTTDLVKLAADMASVKNTTPEDAIIALGAAMRSEYEPLRKYGVVLNDVQLRERAFALGIYDGTGALNSQQRILAARSEVMEQLSFAMGDFVDTSDQLANSQRILAAETENLKMRVGRGLLPVFIGLTQTANSLIGALDRLPDGVLQGAGALALLGTAALGAIGVISKLAVTLKLLEATAALSGLTSILGVALPIAAIAGGAAIISFGLAARQSAADAKSLQKAIEGVNEAMTATRGDEKAAVELQLRGIVDAGSVADEALKKVGVTVEQFNRDALVALQQGETGLKNFEDKYQGLIETGMTSPLINLQSNEVGALQGAVSKVLELDEAWKRASASAQQAARDAKSATDEQTLSAQREREALEREYEQIIKNRTEAVKGKNEALRDLADAKTALIEAQAKALADFEEAQRRFTQSIADQERAIERQRQSVEEAFRSIEDAERRVVQAVRSEQKAREGISRAIEDQREAASGVVEAQKDAADAQEAYNQAVAKAQAVMRGYSASSQQAADALENLDDAQRRLRGSQLGLEDSAIALADAQSDLDRLRRFYGNTSSPSALRRLADAERAVARAQLDHADATDELESSTKDVDDAQTQYGYTINGFPADSDEVVTALKEQDAALKTLEATLKRVEGAQRAVVDSQRALDEAYIAADDAARGVEEAQYAVGAANRDAQWAADDLRRSEWELATYRSSGQPQFQADSVRAAEDAIREARGNLAAETWNLMAAEQALAAFRANNPNYYQPSSSPINTTPGFMNGYGPAGSSFATIHHPPQAIPFPYTTGKYIADTLTRYLRATGQMPQYGSPWPH